jgi:hypothetical protein
MRLEAYRAGFSGEPADAENSLKTDNHTVGAYFAVCIRDTILHVMFLYPASDSAVNMLENLGDTHAGVIVGHGLQAIECVDSGLQIEILTAITIELDARTCSHRSRLLPRR